jgi:photosystem II stability/assembly factor-like uncharacterized protein
MSTDNGNTWTEKNNGLKNYSVLDIEILDDSSIILVTFSGGVFRSTDNGDSWIKDTTPLIGTETLSDIGVRTLVKSNGTLYAGTEYAGVIHSTDNGLQWTPFTYGLPRDRYANSLILKDSLLFAGLYWSGGVFRSSDNGETWESVSSSELEYQAVFSFEIIGTTLFAGTNNGGVFRTVDNGETWEQVNNGLPLQPIRTLAVKDSILLVGMDSAGVYRSTDYGDTWIPIISGLMNLNIKSLAVRNSILFAGTSGNGVYRSTDNGESWTEINVGLVKQSGFALAKNGNSLFIATLSDGGLYRSNDMGDSWLPANMGLDDQNINSLGVKGTLLFAGTSDRQGAFRSTDNGNNWLPANVGLHLTSVYNFVEVGTDLFAGTSDGVFHSTNDGDSWSQVNTSGSMYQGIMSMAVRGKTIFASPYASGGIFQSNDYGNSWTKTGMKSSRAWSIIVKGSTIIAGVDGGAYRSVDNGINWTYINPSNNYSVSSLLVSGNLIFAGTEGGNGVSVSSDDGATWTKVGVELVDKQVESLILSGSTLFAGTWGSGVWKYDISALSADNDTKEPLADSHLNCHPNPATNSLTIDRTALPFNTANTIHYTIATITGETLMEFEQSEPRFSIPIETIGSGVYYVVARQGTLRSAVLFTVIQ